MENGITGSTEGLLADISYLNDFLGFLLSLIHSLTSESSQIIARNLQSFNTQTTTGAPITSYFPIPLPLHGQNRRNDHLQ